MNIRSLNSVFVVCMALVTSVPAYVSANDPATRQTTDVIDLSDVKVQFRIKVLGFARIKGQFERFSGVMMNDENGNAYDVSMRIDVSSINTNDHERDELLRGSGFFEVDRYPLITFNGNCKTRSADGQMRLIGQLELRGHSRQVVFEIIEFEKENGVYSYRAKTRIKRSDFGLNALKHIVSDDVEITVAL